MDFQACEASFLVRYHVMLPSLLGLVSKSQRRMPSAPVTHGCHQLRKSSSGIDGEGRDEEITQRNACCWQLRCLNLVRCPCLKSVMSHEKSCIFSELAPIPWSLTLITDSDNKIVDVLYRCSTTAKAAPRLRMMSRDAATDSSENPIERSAGTRSGI